MSMLVYFSDLLPLGPRGGIAPTVQPVKTSNTKTVIIAASIIGIVLLFTLFVILFLLHKRGMMYRTRNLGVSQFTNPLYQEVETR